MEIVFHSEVKEDIKDLDGNIDLSNCLNRRLFYLF